MCRAINFVSPRRGCAAVGTGSREPEGDACPPQPQGEVLDLARRELRPSTGAAATASEKFRGDRNSRNRLNRTVLGPIPDFEAHGLDRRPLLASRRRGSHRLRCTEPCGVALKLGGDEFPAAVCRRWRRGSPLASGAGELRLSTRRIPYSRHERMRIRIAHRPRPVRSLMDYSLQDTV